MGDGGNRVPLLQVKDLHLEKGPDGFLEVPSPARPSRPLVLRRNVHGRQTQASQRAVPVSQSGVLMIETYGGHDWTSPFPDSPVYFFEIVQLCCVFASIFFRTLARS